MDIKIHEQINFDTLIMTKFHVHVVIKGLVKCNRKDRNEYTDIMKQVIEHF